MVQEALTNTLKHAGPSRAEVALRWCGDSLELEVTDEGRSPAASSDGRGLASAEARAGQAGLRAAGSARHGIAGMRERAGLHGGSVEAGPRLGGGFAVRVRIPLLERQAA